MSVNAFGQSGKSSGSSVNIDSSSFLKVDGSKAMMADLSMGSKKVVDLATPVNDTDAANKAYADTKLSLAGGTMTGNVMMNSTSEVIQPKTPSTVDSLCNKTYVDSQDALKLNLSGGSMSGNLTMSGVTEVIQATAPSTGNSLVNKTYADNIAAGKL